MANTANAGKGQAHAGTRRRFKLLFTIMVVFLGLAGYKFFGQMQQYDETDKRLAAIKQQLEEATKESEELKAQINRLNDPEYIAQLATKEQGMVKIGEQQIFKR